MGRLYLIGERMFVLPEGPKKLYSLYYPTVDHFTVYPPLSSEECTQRREFRSPPLFVPEHAFGIFGALENPGHRGIFHFDERHLDFAYRNGVLWNGTQFPFYASFLVVDLDREGDGYLKTLESAFAGYDYLVYNSGGAPDRYHFVVPHNLISSPNFNLSYTALMAEAGVRFDPSIWSPLCAVALPGTPHAETGVKKRLIKTNCGERLRIENVAPEAMLKKSKEIFRGERWSL